MKKAMTRDDVEREVLRLDPNLDLSSSTFRSACILLGSLVVGPNADRVAKFLECPRDPVREVGRRLRENEVWDGGLVYGDWLDPEVGAIGFWLDVCVADGLVTRRHG